MPPHPIGEKPMTNAERQARYRAARATGMPLTRTRRPADHRSRSRRWLDAVATLTTLQAEYAAWLETLPTSLHDSGTGVALSCRRSASWTLASFRPLSRYGAS